MCNHVSVPHVYSIFEIKRLLLLTISFFLVEDNCYILLFARLISKIPRICYRIHYVVTQYEVRLVLREYGSYFKAPPFQIVCDLPFHGVISYLDSCFYKILYQRFLTGALKKKYD